MTSALKRGLTFANVVAMLALTVSLSGGVYAAAKISGEDIKNRSITGADIKANAIRSKHVKNGSLKDADLQESAASTAGPAAGTSEELVTSLRVAATSGASPDAARAAAPEHLLFTAGPLSVYAKCYSSSTTTYAFAYIRSATNGAVFASGPEFDKKEGDAATGFLNTDTPESEREIQTATAGADSADYWRQKTTAFAPDGTGMSGMFAAGAKNGTLPGGNGAYGAGNSCIFTADVRRS